MSFKVDLQAENAERAKLFADLSAHRKLSTLVMLAVDAYLNSDEGIRVAKVLTDSSNGARKQRGQKPLPVGDQNEKTRTREEPSASAAHNVAAHDLPAERPADIPLIKRKNSLESTGSVLGRIIKPMKREDRV
jgi:hypothetical protein